MNIAAVEIEKENKVMSGQNGWGHVLVVDDEEHNRTLLRDPLEAQGYHIAEAENGTQALAQASSFSPDVILLDIMMPGMDGFEVCRQLKSSSRTAPVPVLIVTALSERKERLLGIQAGANDFLTKPIDIQDVMLRVKNAVYTKKLFDQLQAEKKKSDALLLNVLPQWATERMKAGQSNIADYYPEATVLFTDLVGFSTLSANIGPAAVVNLLNELFTAFDELTEQLGLEKIKTIGDAYMAAAGIPLPKSNHAEAILELAFRIRREIKLFNAQYRTSLRVRTGIATGPVMAGVIGRKKFAYDVWGDTVNIANQLASTGEPDCIHVAESTFLHVSARKQLEEFPLHLHSTLNMKGTRKELTYQLL